MLPKSGYRLQPIEKRKMCKEFSERNLFKISYFNHFYLEILNKRRLLRRDLHWSYFYYCISGFNLFFRNEYRWWKSFIAACWRNDVLSFWEYHIFEKLFGESNTGVRRPSQQVKFINLDKSTIIYKKLNLKKMSERRSAVSGRAGGYIIRKLSSQWAGRETAKNPDISSRAT